MRHRKLIILILVLLGGLVTTTAYLGGLEIKGNAPSMIYHVPGCPNYAMIRMNAEEGDRWFLSEADAQAAGFIKAKNCKH